MISIKMARKKPNNYTYHWHRNQSEAKQYDFRINYRQNYESESESEIQGEISMWTWIWKIICPNNINTKAKAKEYFRGINFTLISVSMVHVLGNLVSNHKFVTKVLGGPPRHCAAPQVSSKLVVKTWAKSASHEKFHAALSMKQAHFLEGPLPLRIPS